MYNIAADPGETKDLSKEYPQLFAEMIRDYEAYAKKCGVIDLGTDYEAHKVVLGKVIKMWMNAVLPWLIGLILLLSDGDIGEELD
ncbi:MAG: hypothetical protein HC892_18265 [Saprospiraceae bacterium]|nr:hypothetical protein [Saprospiraceae bacterium]